MTKAQVPRQNNGNPICDICDYRMPHPPHPEVPGDSFHPPLPEVFEFDENGNVINAGLVQ